MGYCFSQENLCIIKYNEPHWNWNLVLRFLIPIYYTIAPTAHPSIQYLVFSSGHPSGYLQCSILLNFGDHAVISISMWYSHNPNLITIERTDYALIMGVTMAKYDLQTLQNSFIPSFLLWAFLFLVLCILLTKTSFVLLFFFPLFSFCIYNPHCLYHCTHFYWTIPILLACVGFQYWCFLNEKKLNFISFFINYNLYFIF